MAKKEFELDLNSTATLTGQQLLKYLKDDDGSLKKVIEKMYVPPKMALLVLENFASKAIEGVDPLQGIYAVISTYFALGYLTAQEEASAKSKLEEAGIKVDLSEVLPPDAD